LGYFMAGLLILSLLFLIPLFITANGPAIVLFIVGIITLAISIAVAITGLMDDSISFEPLFEKKEKE